MNTVHGTSTTFDARLDTPLDCHFESTVEDASIDDYDALAHTHYLKGRPPTVVLVRRLRVEDTLAAVLVVTHPPINATWRRLVWPDVDLRTVRRLARVLVEPRLRGLGLATALVRDYLRDPLTARTEAVTRLGHHCPLFERAGMSPIVAPPSRATRRLRRACAGLDPDRLLTGDIPESLRPELRRWGRASRATRTLPPEDVPFHAASILLRNPIAYTHATTTR